MRGKNVGSVPVVVYRERDGERDSLTTLLPGAPFDAVFPARSTAIFRNTSRAVGANVAIRVTGDVSSLGMTYERSGTR